MPGLVMAAGAGSSADERSRASLGEALFFDVALSADGKVACASCHLPERAFASPEARARGVFGRTGTRNAPGLLGVGRQAELFWDGRRTSLEQLVLDPFTTPEEHGFSDVQQVLAAVRARHAPGFARAFPGEGVTAETVSQVLAAYVRSLTAGPSAMERHLAGQVDALNASEKRGLALFTGRAACARCHSLEGETGSEGAYHPGEMATPELLPRLAGVAQATARMPLEARRAAVPARAEVAALGRFVVTLRPPDIGRFRTPSLRNVAVTAPYMHDGSVPTLAEAVERELYYRTDGGPRVGDLTPSDRADLIAFLHALTSSTFPAAPSASPPVHSLSLKRNTP